MTFRRVFKVRVIYKNGVIQDFECFEFKVTQGPNIFNLSWISVGLKRPLWINNNDISSIWSMSSRIKFFWKEPVVER